MKKYWRQGLGFLAFVFLAVFVWLVGSDEKVEELKGLEGQNISASELQRWINPDSDTVSEIGEELFYVQEAIGSEGFEMIAPKAVDGDFILKFDMMSLTKKSALRFTLAKENSTEAYALEINSSANAQIFKIWQNQTLLKQIEFNNLEPDVFYPLQFEKIDDEILFVFNNQELLKATQKEPEKQTRFIFEVFGAVDNPAALEIKNMKLFSE